MTGEFTAPLGNRQCACADFGLIGIGKTIRDGLLAGNQLGNLQLVGAGGRTVGGDRRQDFFIAADDRGGLETIGVRQRRADGLQGVQLRQKIGIGAFLRGVGRDPVLKLRDRSGIQRNQLADDRAGVDAADQTDAGSDLTHCISDARSLSRFDGVGDVFMPLVIHADTRSIVQNRTAVNLRTASSHSTFFHDRVILPQYFSGHVGHQHGVGRHFFQGPLHQKILIGGTNFPKALRGRREFTHFAYSKTSFTTNLSGAYRHDSIVTLCR